MATPFRDVQLGFHHGPGYVLAQLAPDSLPKAQKRPGALHINEPSPPLVFLDLTQEAVYIAWARDFDRPERREISEGGCGPAALPM